MNLFQYCLDPTGAISQSVQEASAGRSSQTSGGTPSLNAKVNPCNHLTHEHHNMVSISYWEIQMWWRASSGLTPAPGHGSRINCGAGMRHRSLCEKLKTKIYEICWNEVPLDKQPFTEKNLTHQFTLPPSPRGFTERGEQTIWTLPWKY